MNNSNLYSFFNKYTLDCIKKINLEKLNSLIEEIVKLRKNKGRIFFIGVGGSAANCSHANNDFRKIAQINSFCLTDNVAELTARTNDQGWDNIFSEMLKVYNINNKDMIFIMSVGGGSLKKKISVNLINAIKYAKKNKLKVVSIVGKSDGYAAINSDISIILQICKQNLVTPISESIQALVWHSIVSDSRILKNKTTW